jgi:hypothetical protein
MPLPRPENPFPGDIHFLGDAPQGDWRRSKETNFEVWDGQRWVHAREAYTKVNIQYQVTESGVDPKKAPS